MGPLRPLEWDDTQMNQFFLVSHGTMAEGMYKALSMFVPTDNVRYACLEDGMGIEEFKVRLKETLEKFDAEQNLVVLADLMGGSPYTCTIGCLSELGLMARAHVIAGASLPLAMELIMADDDLTDEHLQSYIDEARSCMALFTQDACEEDEGDL